MVWLLFIIDLMGLFFYNKIGSIISIGDLPTTNIIEPNKWIGIFHLNRSGRVSLTDYRNYLFIIFTLAVALIFLKLKKKYNGRVIKK